MKLDNGFALAIGNEVFMSMLLQIMNLVIVLGGIVLTIYIMVLLVKFLKRGIQAFDIYIQNNPKDESE